MMGTCSVFAPPLHLGVGLLDGAVHTKQACIDTDLMDCRVYVLL